MKLRHYTIIATLALLAASCAHEESEVAQIFDVQVVIEASFTETKATTKSTATAFESGDMLGLYAVKSGGELSSQSNLINNHQLKVAESGAIVGDQLPAYYPDKSSSLDLFSYYPYQSGNATADALGVLVGIRTHQTDFSSLQASDLCCGRKLDAAPSAAPHPLQFRHSFAQLRLNFSLYEGCSAISAVKLLSIKDSAKLNLQTGVVTLLTSSVADVDPYVNNLLSYTAIIPAQSLSGACVEITLKDGTIYYYHATTPIALKESATNTLNLTLSDKGKLTLASTPAITAWGVEESNAVLGDAVNNLVTLHWLAPHASYASIDKITISMVDIFNRRREVDVTPTIDPLSSAEYATITFPLALPDAGYPQIIEGIKLYAGATLIRNSPRAAILGSILSKAGAHTIWLNLVIEITPQEDWLGVTGHGCSRMVTIVALGASSWTAIAAGSGLSVIPTSGTSGQTATITWTANAAFGSTPAIRKGEVTFFTSEDLTTTIKTTQNGINIPEYVVINGRKWRTFNVGAASNWPWEYGNYYNWQDAMSACPFGWRLPIAAEQDALSTVGHSEWTSLNGIYGLWFGSNPGDPATSIFLPAAGHSGRHEIGYSGHYWSLTPISSTVSYELVFYFAVVNPSTSRSTDFPFSVRCVDALALELSTTGQEDIIPTIGGSYQISVKSNTTWTATATNATLSVASGGAGETAIVITVPSNGQAVGLPVTVNFTTGEDSSGVRATALWGATQQAFKYVNINGLKWSVIDWGTRGYTWNEAQTVCPSGWRLPTSIEYSTLFGGVGDRQIWADCQWGMFVGNGAWAGPGAKVADPSTALFLTNLTSGHFHYWTSTQRDDATGLCLAFDKNIITSTWSGEKTAQYTVRCVQ